MISRSAPQVLLFQSTLPVRGATSGSAEEVYSTEISIHAPRTGSDGFAILVICRVLYFNPRSPYGERHPAQLGQVSLKLFQSTLPVRGATKRKAVFG